MVASVQEDTLGSEDEEEEDGDEDFHSFCSPVHEVPVEQVHQPVARQAVLSIQRLEAIEIHGESNRNC